MFFKNSSNKAPNRIDTLVGANTRIEGNIVFSGGLRVDGFILGNVTETGDMPSALIISENGQVEGTVTVSQVVLNGKITGPVHANEYVELQSKARVIGDVHYRSIEMHTGAVIEGNLVYDGNPHEVKLLTNKD